MSSEERGVAKSLVPAARRAQLDLIPVEQLHTNWERVRECGRPVALIRVDETKLPRGWHARPAAEGAPAQLVKPCDSRRCEGCGPRWKKRVLAKMFSGVRDRESLKLITLTAPGTAGGLVDTESIDAWNETAPRRWNSFALSLRRAFPGVGVEYFRVAELQARGAIHYHVVVAGVPFLPKDLLDRLASRAGFGWVDVRLVRNPGQAVGYLGKYLLKKIEEWPPGRRVYALSRGWPVAWVRFDRRGPWADVDETGEQFLSISGWVFDIAATRRLRATLRRGGYGCGGKCCSGM